MGPVVGCWRDTWWVWCLFLALVIILTFTTSRIFVVLIVGLPVMFLYFAYNRYDEHGNEIGGS